MADWADLGRHFERWRASAGGNLRLRVSKHRYRTWGTHAWLLPLAFLVLLPIGALYNIATLVMAMLGLASLVKAPQQVLEDIPCRMLLALFLCLWFPMLISCFDAVNVPEAVRKTVSYPAFLLSGVCVVRALKHERAVDKLLAGVFIIVTFWCLDALWQFVAGQNLLGFPYSSGRLTGVFYPKWTLGVVLALLSPLYFEAIRRLSLRVRWITLFLLPYFLVIGLGGSRSSWVALGISAIAYAFYLCRWVGVQFRTRRVVRAALVVIVIAGTSGYFLPSLSTKAGAIVVPRIEAMKGLFSSDRDQIDAALALRLSIWQTAINVVHEHWLNGIGPRGFRYAYAAHAPRDDYWISSDIGVPTHPHLLLLEIAVETGLVGVCGYVLFVVFLMRKMARMSRERLVAVFPFVLGVFVAVLPFNVHHSFYGHFSSSLIWWFIAVAIAAYGAMRESSTPQLMSAKLV